MGQRRVLVVEDEATIAESVAARLRAEGFAVQIAGDGPSAVAAVRRDRPDLVVLDVMLPGFDGLEVCRRIQTGGGGRGVMSEPAGTIPVLMLTARDDETDLLVGLAVGADDYLTKPFSMRELTARVHALLRRVDRAASPAAGAEPPPTIRLADLEINQAERRVRRAGVEAHLTPTEFDLLVHLAGRPRTVLPRERLLAEVWGWADGAGTRTVDSHVKALRRKLGADLIRTVHGVGYALEVPAA
jgi:DNA-binding response OmpR family regulator